MSNFLLRVFASAIVRCCAYALFACVALYACDARAADDTHPTSYEAWTHCQQVSEQNVQNPEPGLQVRNRSPLCIDWSSGSSYGYREHWTYEFFNNGVWNSGVGTGFVHTYASATCPNGGVWNPDTHECSTPCSQKSPLGDGFWTTSEHTGGACNVGCQYVPLPNNVYPVLRIDGVNYILATGWVPAGDGATCPVGDNDFVLLPPDADGDGVSDGNDADPNNPGVNGPQDPPPKDPDCGKAGKPSCPDNGNGEHNESNGGGDCTFPPASSGDAIAAMTAYQTWATRCAVEAQKALMQATVDKLEAMKQVQLAQSTASKQDDIKAQIALSAAQLSQLQAAQTVEIQNTNAKLAGMDANRTNEVATTNAKIQALDDRNKAEQDETQARIDAFNESQATLTADTNAKLEALKGLSQDSLDKMTASGMTAQEAAEHLQDILSNILLDAPKQDSIKTNTQTSADVLAVIRDAQQAQATVAHTDADELKAKMDALKASIDGGVNVHCDNCAGSGGETDMGETNGLLGDIKGKLSDIAIGISPLAGILNTASQISTQIGDLRDQFGSLSEWFKQTGAGTHDPTGEDADPSTVSRTVEIGADGFDQSGFGYSRSCPPPVTIPVFGQTLTFETDILCNWLAVGGWFVLLITAWKCIQSVVSA